MRTIYTYKSFLLVFLVAMSRALTGVLHYIRTLTVWQLFSVAMMLIVIDQSSNTFVLFGFFAVFFFSFFAQIRQGALFTSILYLIYFLWQLSGGALDTAVFLSMVIYYSILCTLLLLAITPSFLADLEKGFQESFLGQGWHSIHNHYKKSDGFKSIVLISLIAVGILFLFWLGVDIYKSFLGRSIVWSGLTSLGLVVIIGRYIFLHPFVRSWFHKLT